MASKYFTPAVITLALFVVGTVFFGTCDTPRRWWFARYPPPNYEFPACKMPTGTISCNDQKDALATCAEIAPLPTGLFYEQGDFPGDLGTGASYCCPHDTNLTKNLKGDVICVVRPRKSTH